ncbi:MAG TPA: trehalose-phosphatase [Caulobacteraceae bacterium]|jgi:trehalose 6-phosphate phosphatase|nr:trehalose-phosphatase [Caulobacteraceae bacterium]
MQRAGTGPADEALSVNQPPARPAPLDAEGVALFLDLDGVLAPIVARPQDVVPLEERTRLMRALQAALGGRLAVISGRTIADLDRILDGAVPALAGVHGLERRLSDGRLWRAEPSRALDRARAAFEPLARDWPGVMVEEKGLSVGVHYRAAPGAEAAVREVVEALTPSGDLVAQWGQMVAELRTPGPDKGDALTAFMAEPPFCGSRPVFVGDDQTDEHGFAAAAAGGGFGVLVGPDRPTAAQMRLESIEAVYDWLSAAAGRDGAA